MVVGVAAVIARHPENVFHGVEADALDEDVADEAAAADACLDADCGFGVDGDDVLGADILYAAGHLAAEGDDGAAGGDACDTADEDVLARPAVAYAVLVPAALDGDAIVAGDDEAFLDQDVGA